MTADKKEPRKRTKPQAPPPEINFGDKPPATADPLPEQSVSMPAPKPVENIHQAVLAIMGQVPVTFPSVSALNAALRPLLIQHGVMPMVVATSLFGIGGQTIRLLHVPSGTAVDITANGVLDALQDLLMVEVVEVVEVVLPTRPDTPPLAIPVTTPAPSTTAPATAPAPAPAPQPDGVDVDEAEAERAAAEVSETNAAVAAEALARASAPPPAKAPVFAEVHISQQRRAIFEQWVARLIAKFPPYSIQKDGKGTTLPDMNHIRATALALGHKTIDDVNYQTVLEAIAKHATEKGEGVGDKTPGSGGASAKKAATKTASAKRPTNDEALKRAGF